MSDLILRTSVKASVARDRAISSLESALVRLRDNESGQDMIEYIGVLVVVAAVIVGVLGIFDSSFFSSLGTHITDQLNKIFGSSSGGGTGSNTGKG
jgi:Flp pilus assembly pilin Flp